LHCKRYEIVIKEQDLYAIKEMHLPSSTALEASRPAIELENACRESWAGISFLRYEVKKEIGRLG
jgi:hypothetical protein